MPQSPRDNHVLEVLVGSYEIDKGTEQWKDESIVTVLLASGHRITGLVTKYRQDAEAIQFTPLKNKNALVCIQLHQIVAAWFGEEADFLS